MGSALEEESVPEASCPEDITHKSLTGITHRLSPLVRVEKEGEEREGCRREGEGRVWMEGRGEGVEGRERGSADIIINIFGWCYNWHVTVTVL